MAASEDELMMHDAATDDGDESYDDDFYSGGDAHDDDNSDDDDVMDYDFIDNDSDDSDTALAHHRSQVAMARLQQRIFFSEVFLQDFEQRRRTSQTVALETNPEIKNSP